MRGHIDQPFRILREAGVAAELRCLLLADAAFSRTIQAQLPTHAAKSSSPARAVQVASVQLEITAIPAPQQQPAGDPKTLDIAILHPGCALTCARNGPGDVIRQIKIHDLSAAIEVKASPSKDLSTGGAYARDIDALLRLAKSGGVKSYFVLLDKSSALYGTDGITVSTTNTEELPRWMQDRPDAFHHEPHRKQGSRKRVPGNLRQKNITMSSTAPGNGVPYVEVWTIEWDLARRAWSPVVRFAF